MRAVVVTSIVLAVSAAPARADEAEERAARMAEERAVRRVERLFGYVGRNEYQVGRPVDFVSLHDRDVTDADLIVLAAFKELRCLELDDAGITGSGLKYLAPCKKLIDLYLSNSDVSDRGLSAMASLRSLRRLSLNSTAVGDEGLRHLNGLTDLTELKLACTRITDDGLKHLLAMPRLKHLDLDMTSLTDRGLENLRGFKHLLSLSAFHTHVTEKGVREFRKSHPGCDVRWDNEDSVEIAPPPRVAGVPAPGARPAAGTHLVNEEVGLSPELERLPSRIAVARTPEEAAELYERLWRHNTRGLNRTLMQAPQDGVALQAALQEVALSPRMPHNRRWTFGVTRLGSPSLERFLGFVEGRTGVKPPDWWAAAMRRAEVTDRGTVVPGWPANMTSSPYGATTLDGRTYSLPKEQTLRREKDGRLTLICGRDEAVIARKVEKEHLENGDVQLSALIDKDHAYLSIHSRFGSIYPLVCVDRRTGIERWSTKVWNMGVVFAGGTGIHYEFAAVLQQKDRIVVFGMGVGGIYIEAFDKATGKNLYRFANNLVYDRKE